MSCLIDDERDTSLTDLGSVSQYAPSSSEFVVTWPGQERLHDFTISP